jgi:hypothetical protein
MRELKMETEEFKKREEEIKKNKINFEGIRLSKTDERIIQTIYNFIKAHRGSFLQINTKELQLLLEELIKKDEDLKRLNKYDTRIQLSLETSNTPLKFFKDFYKDMVNISLNRI